MKKYLTVLIITFLAVSCKTYRQEDCIELNRDLPTFVIGTYIPDGCQADSVSGSYASWHVPELGATVEKKARCPHETRLILFSKTKNFKPVPAVSVVKNDGKYSLSVFEKVVSTWDYMKIVDFFVRDAGTLIVNYCAISITRKEYISTSVMVDLFAKSYSFPGEFVKCSGPVSDQMDVYANRYINDERYFYAYYKNDTYVGWSYWNSELESELKHSSFPTRVRNNTWAFSGSLENTGWPSTMSKGDYRYEIRESSNRWTSGPTLSCYKNGRREYKCYGVYYLDLRIWDYNGFENSYSDSEPDVLTQFFDYSSTGKLSGSHYYLGRHRDYYIHSEFDDDGGETLCGIKKANSGYVDDIYAEIHEDTDVGFFFFLLTRVYVLRVKNEDGIMKTIASGSRKEMEEELVNYFYSLYGAGGDPE